MGDAAHSRLERIDLGKHNGKIEYLENLVETPHYEHVRRLFAAFERKAGKVEFRDEFVQAEPMQAMQKRIETRFDPDIEAMGFDKMRSRIQIQLKSGETVSGDADERYRGGPENPLTDDELKDKVRSCCEGVLSADDTERLIDAALGVTEMDDAAALATYLRVSL